MKMTQEDYVKKLIEDLEDLDNALHWLKRFYGICKNIGIKEEYKKEEFDALKKQKSSNPRKFRGAARLNMTPEEIDHQCAELRDEWERIF